MKRNFLNIRPIALALGLIISATAERAAAITITLDFTPGTGQIALTNAQKVAFTQAKNFWEAILPTYKPGVTQAGLTIQAAGRAIDGVGNVLGGGGPDTTVVQGGFTLTKTGSMEFDTADMPGELTAGTFDETVLHEMAHVLGFGTLWTDNNVYVNDSGKYTGAFGLAQYKAEFAAAALFVPVELGGGAGTANGHWNEVNGGVGLTGITNAAGRDMRDELMTGWGGTNEFTSLTTRMSFMDIGFNVVPVPPAIWLFASGMGLLLGFMKKRS